MDYSQPAWLGALAGMVIAAIIYGPAIRAIERRLRASRGPETLERRAAFEQQLSVVRRLILAADIAILAVAGYWIGGWVGGSGAAHSQF